MRTKIACGWLVGNENGRHVLWRDAELVYEDDRVIFIGKSFEGVIDREIDACNRLVAERKTVVAACVIAHSWEPRGSF